MTGTLHHRRRGSRINTDRFPKRGAEESSLCGSPDAPPGIFLGFNSLKFPFPGFCLMPGNWKKKTFVQTIFQISTWKVLQLLLKIYLLWKTWPISVKRWKQVWIRACIGWLTNPFSSSIIPGLGTRLLVSSIRHFQVGTGLCFKPTREGRSLCIGF